MVLYLEACFLQVRRPGRFLSTFERRLLAHRCEIVGSGKFPIVVSHTRSFSRWQLSRISSYTTKDELLSTVGLDIEAFTDGDSAE